MSKQIQINQQRFGAGRPRICVPIIGKSAEEILDAAERLTSVPADVVEWRADFFEEIANLGAVVTVLDQLYRRMNGKLLLFTFRSKQEGGSRSIAAEDYFTLCKVVCETGWAELLDIELSRGEEMVRALLREAHQNRVHTILSQHDFEGTPPLDALLNTLQTMHAYGTDFAKLAVMPQHNQDVLTLLRATAAFSADEEHCPCITMAMGDLGKISRLSGELFGSVMTFGAVGQTSAPGQMDASLLRQMLTTLQL